MLICLLFLFYLDEIGWNLTIKDNTPLRKVDLHIHTPRSFCYSDKTVTAGQIVEAALAKKLDAIAVTDHNTFEGVESIRCTAQGKGLVVFPGVELSTKSGHFLALFEANKPLAELREVLAESGIKPANWGDATVFTEGTAETVFRSVVAHGGLVIAAHIERWPSGFLETKSTKKEKMAIHNNPDVSALEITVAQDKDNWNKGEQRGFQRKHTCIQGSDAHSPAEIGRRPVFIRMEEISLAALREAFLDFEDSIVFP
jgi:PHP family Zn ribbon phosphoesterase